MSELDARKQWFRVFVRPWGLGTHDRDDVVMEGLLRFLERTPWREEAPPDDLERRTATRQSNARRQALRRARQVRGAREHICQAPDPGREEVRRRVREEVSALLSELSEQDRRILVLVVEAYQEGARLSAAALAREVGLSVWRTKRRVASVLCRLRGKLREAGLAPA